MLEQIDSIPLLESLSPPRKAELAHRFRSVSFTKGELIAGRGEPCERVLFVVDGQVRITLESPGGREVVVALRGPGSLVGELSALDGQCRCAALYGETAGLCLALSLADFEWLLSTNNELCRQLLAEGALRLRQSLLALEAAAIKTLRQRVAEVLLEEARTSGVPYQGGILLPKSLTYKTLVGRLGTIRESVSRVVGKFRKEGLLARVQQRFLILDREGLRSTALAGADHGEAARR